MSLLKIMKSLMRMSYERLHGKGLGLPVIYDISDAGLKVLLLRQQSAERCIVLAAKLVAPSIESSFSLGYDWIVDTIKASPHAAIASEIEIAKAIQFLKAKDFSKVRTT